MIRCIIIDDETPARELVKAQLKKYSEIELVAECTNGFEGFMAIKEHNPDLVFLDIQMPKITGFEMLELVDEKPNIIFITAYDQFAIKAFEHNAIDYLLKPFSPARFAEAVEKAQQRVEKDAPAAKVEKLLQDVRDNHEELQRIVVKNGPKIDLIPINEIRYIQAEDDYVMIYSTKGRFLKKITMNYLEEHLPKETFVRVHRSHIISTMFIEKLERYGKETFIVKIKNGEDIKTSKAGAKRLKELLEI